MSVTFFQETSEVFLNFTKSALRRTKKTHQRVLTNSFETNFKGKTSFYLASQKKSCWHSPTSFEYGFS